MNPEQKKICIVNLNPGMMGGVEKYWDGVVSLMPQVYWSVFTDIERSQSPQTIPVEQRIDGLRWKNIWASSKNLWRYLKSSQPDVLFLNGTLAELMVFPVLLLLRLFQTKIKIICIYHNAAIYPQPWKSWFNRFLLRCVALTHHQNIFISEYVKTYWNLPGKVLKKPVLPMPRHVVPKSEYTIAFVGRLSEEKGPDLFCEIARALGAGDKALGFRFYVAGDGPMREALKKTYPEIEFLGWVESVSEFLKSVDLLLVTSRTEGLSLAAFEALEHGVPVLGFHVGGVPEVVGDCRVGWLNPEQDIKGVVQNVLRFFAGYEINYESYFEVNQKTSPARQSKTEWAHQLVLGEVSRT